MKKPELTLFYDGKCPICALEMQRMARLDRMQKLAYLDMAAPDFDASQYGTTLAAMDAELHGLTRAGRLLVGIDCIAMAYALIGRAWLVWPLKIRPLQPMWRVLYRGFARNRYRVSRFLGVRPETCVNGSCTLR